MFGLAINVIWWSCDPRLRTGQVHSAMWPTDVLPGFLRKPHRICQDNREPQTAGVDNAQRAPLDVEIKRCRHLLKWRLCKAFMIANVLIDSI